MSYTIESVNCCTKKILFNYNELDLTSEILDALKEKRKTASLKGYRKGKAPLDLVEKMYRPQVEHEALSKFIQNRFFETIQKEDIKAIGYPAFRDTKYEAGKSVSFHVIVETLPEFELKDFSGYSFTQDDQTVDETEVEKLRNNYLSSKSEVVSLEEDGAEVKKGQVAVINFEGELESGDKPDNMKGSEHLLELGSGQFIPGFEEQVEGMKAGEKKTINVTFPQEYHAEDLKGAKVNFHVELLEIKEKKIPELTDEIAKEFGFSSKDDFLEKTKSNLEFQKKRQVQEKLHGEILDKIIQENDFDVPQTLITNQEDYVKKDLASQLKQQGFTDQMLDEYYEKWAEDISTKALHQVRSSLILDKVAQEHNIEATQDDLNGKIQEMVDQSGLPKEQVEAMYMQNENAKNNLMYAIREEKTFDKIKEIVKLN